MGLKTLLLPCIYVYKFFAGIIKLLGLFIKYIFQGLIVIIKQIGKFFKYVLLGFKNFPLIIISVLSHFVLTFQIIFGTIRNSNQEKREKKAKEREIMAKKHREELIEKAKREQAIQKEKENALREKITEAKEKESKRKKHNDDNIYINENIKRERKTIGDKFEDFGNSIINLPKNTSNFFKRKWNNLSFIKEAKNKKDINREVLLIDFNSDDAKKSKVKLTYKYEVRTPEGKEVTGYFDAYSKVEVHSFLLSEGNTVYSIKTSKWIQLFHGSHGSSHAKIKTKDLIFLLAQLSTYLKAGIPLVDSVKILIKQFKNPSYQKILRGVVYDLSTGQSFSEALSKQGDAFPRLLINMVKASEMTGELPEALDDMEAYYSEAEATRKAMVSAMMYPIIIFIVAIGVGLFIMLYVVPKFVEIYDSMDNAEIPGITQFVLDLSSFLGDYAIWIGLGFIAFLLIFMYLFRKVKSFRATVQWIGMHLPVFGNVIIYNEVTMFTKTFSSLLAHNVFITDSMDILNKVTNNEIYKMMIIDAITNIAKGDKISSAFKDQWAFPIPAYEMIVTGEKTGQLPEMMAKVSTYYQDLHRNSVSRIKTFIEPVMIILLTVMVGVIVLAIVVPMFNMYSAIQQ